MSGKGIAGKTLAPPTAKGSIFRGVKGRLEWVGSLACPFNVFPTSCLAGNYEVYLATRNFMSHSLESGYM